MLSERRPPIFHSNAEPVMAPVMGTGHHNGGIPANFEVFDIKPDNVVLFPEPDNLGGREGRLPNVDQLVLEYRDLLELGKNEKASRTISRALRQLWPHIETVVNIHFGKNYRRYEEARKLLSCSVTKDDLMEEAHLIILNSIEGWDQNKGAPFAYYLLKALRSYLKRFDFKLCHNRVGTAKRRHRTLVSVDTPLSEHSEEVTAGERIAGRSQDEIESDMREDLEEEIGRELLVKSCLKGCSLLDSWIYILSKGLGEKAIKDWKTKFTNEISSTNNKYYDKLKMIYWSNKDLVAEKLKTYLENEPTMLAERERSDVERLKATGKRDTRSRRRSDLINVQNNPPKNEEEIALYFYLCAYRYQGVSGSIIAKFLDTSLANISLHLIKAEKKVAVTLQKDKNFNNAKNVI